MSDKQKILVLGVGNILFTDEGVGVRVINELLKACEFSDNVELMDGGTLGNRLMGPIMDADFLIVVDAVLGGDKPGSVYRLTGNDLRNSLAFKNSMHDTDLVDVLVQCDLMGKRPDAIVIGIEPYDYQSMAVEISESSEQRLPYMMQFVLDEIEKAGGSYSFLDNPDAITPLRPDQSARVEN